MKKYTKISLFVLIVLALVAAIIYIALVRKHQSYIGTAKPASGRHLIAKADYICDGPVKVEASYYRGNSPAAPVKPGQPPVPDGQVNLNLPSGHTLDLSQTISADGSRYASSDGSWVFWSKGNSFTLTKDNKLLYTGCIAFSKDSGGLAEIYGAKDGSFSVRYPASFKVDNNYNYQELGPGKSIHGVKFTIPETMASGTNLAADTYLSVEQKPDVRDCNAGLFLEGGPNMKVANTMIDNRDYSIASSTGAGAGNRYEETVYALPGTNPCLAVRYFVHYGVIENYPPGMVKAFDRNALYSQFDKILNSLVIR